MGTEAENRPFGLVGFSLNASLEPQLRAQKRARLAEDAPAHHVSCHSQLLLVIILYEALQSLSLSLTVGWLVGCMGGKYNDLVYTGMSIYQYITVYTPGSYLLDLPIRFQ